MKALTGLPTQAYVRVGEEVNVPLKDLLTLVKELESHVSPAYLARYRPDVAAGLDQRQIHRVRERLQEFVELSDRRVMILTALNQQGRLTPELRQEIEEALDRRELDDIYAPYRPKPHSGADDALEHGLDGLARYLWSQQPAESDPVVEAARYVQSDNGVGDASLALEGARQIVARWLAENREVRRDLRQLVRAHALVVVNEVAQRGRLSAKDEAARKRVAGLFGKTFKAAKIAWRQVMQLRRGAREGWLRYAVEMPENEAVEYLLGRLLQQPESEFTLQLSAACRTAFEQYLAVQLEGDVRQEMEDRSDREAVEFYCDNLRKILMTPPAGACTVIGIETGRPGGWRAAVVGADGELLEAAIVHMDRRDREAAEYAARRAAEAEAAKLQEAAQQEAAQQEAAQQEAAQQEAAQQEATQPEAAQQEATQPEEVHPEAAPQEAAQPAASPAGDEAAPDPAPQAEEPAAGQQSSEAPEPSADTAAEMPADEADRQPAATGEQAAVEASAEISSTEPGGEAQVEAQIADARATPSPEDPQAASEAAAEIGARQEPKEGAEPAAEAAGLADSDATPAEQAAATPAEQPAPAPPQQASEESAEQPAAAVEAVVSERPPAQELRSAEPTAGDDSAPAAEPPAGEAKDTAESPAPVEAAPPPAAQRSAAKPKKNRKKFDRVETAEGDLADLIRRHGPELIAIGNGPGVRQVERFIRVAVKRAGRKTAWTTVNEAGSWVYATSKVARAEHPKVEPAVRAAVCLGRRLQNPLAEMSKTDPRLLGIGPGHHEVDQKALRDGLRLTLEEVVSAVGVDVNRDPAELLQLAPGMTDRVARRLVDQRRKKGLFADREALAAAPGLSKAVWRQAAGFLRLPASDNPLDATGAPPQRYPEAEKIFAAAGVSAAEALADPDRLSAVDLDELADEQTPRTVFEALLRELRPAVRNPRGEFTPPTPAVDVEPIEEPRAGMKVEGIVTNVTSFGVFVDIGAEQDGLLHISQLPNELFEDSKPNVKTGGRLTVYVIHYDAATERLSLSMREPRESSRQRRTAPSARRPPGDRHADRRGRSRDRDRGDRDPVRRTFGPDREARKQEEQALRTMSVDEKLELLESKFRTKI